MLLAELKQETATFNPVPTSYDDFQVVSGADVLTTFRGTKTEAAGALDVFEAEDDIEVVPTMSAWAVSGGPIRDSDLDRLIDSILQRARENSDVDGAYFVLHGAMAGETEMDPEGRVLAGLREILPDKPIVASLDLHAILTDRMVDAADLLVPYHTYPHSDHYETGERAARNLTRLLEGTVSPTVARVRIPMLVRGDELLTATGKFGEAIGFCQDIESTPSGLAAGVIIGNPFTDVPDLCSNVIVATDGDLDLARREAERVARFMWDHRDLFFHALTSLEEAIAEAKRTTGLTVFSDAADATASGAPGDSNAILRGLLSVNYDGDALMSLVDAPAVASAYENGVGATIDIALGGTLDPQRHEPLRVNARVERLSDGVFTYEDGTPGRGGRTAVLAIDKIRVVVTERPVYVVGRQVFLAQDLDPRTFDLVVVKSPNGFRTHYESIAAHIFTIDVPGATSANLRSLPFARCSRPIFPLDEGLDPSLTSD